MLIYVVLRYHIIYNNCKIRSSSNHMQDNVNLFYIYVVQIPYIMSIKSK